MRTHGRTDRNQLDIVAALRQIGATVRSLASVGGGVPDLVVGFAKRNLLMEVKRPDVDKSHRALTDDEKRFHETWRGQVVVVHTPEEAIRAVFELTRGDA